MEMLRNGDMDGLAALTRKRPGAVRHLLGRLWDTDPQLRERAAEAIGTAAAEHPELGLELLRRFDWALNDESATNGVAVLRAMAAVAVRSPGMSRPFVGRIVSALGDPALREAALRALQRLEARCPELLEPYREEMDRSTNSRPVGEPGLREGGKWDEN